MVAGGTFDLGTNLDAGVLTYNPISGAGSTQVDLTSLVPAGRVLHIKNNSGASPANDYVNVVTPGPVTINGVSRPVGAPYRVPGRWEALLVHQGAGVWYARHLEDKHVYVGMSFQFSNLNAPLVLQSDYPDYGFFVMENTAPTTIDIQLATPLGGRVLAIKRTGGGAVRLIGTIDGVIYTGAGPLPMTDTAWLLFGHSAPPEIPLSFTWQIVSKMP